MDSSFIYLFRKDTGLLFATASHSGGGGWVLFIRARFLLLIDNESDAMFMSKVTDRLAIFVNNSRQ